LDVVRGDSSDPGTQKASGQGERPTDSFHNADLSMRSRGIPSAKRIGN
jgi:hypothetical protein